MVLAATLALYVFVCIGPCDIYIYEYSPVAVYCNVYQSATEFDNHKTLGLINGYGNAYVHAYIYSLGTIFLLFSSTGF